MSEGEESDFNAKVEVVHMEDASEKYDDGRPIMETVKVEGQVGDRKTTSNKTVVPKKIERGVLMCPEHDVALRHDERGDAVCPIPTCGYMSDEYVNVKSDRRAAQRRPMGIDV